MLENKEFKIQTAPFNDNHIDLINKRYRWYCLHFNKDQLDTLIEILTQLKEEKDGKDGIRL